MKKTNRIIAAMMAAAVMLSTTVYCNSITSNSVTDSAIDLNDLERAGTLLKQFIAEQKQNGNRAFRLASVYSQEELRDGGSIPESFRDKVVVEYYYPDREDFLTAVKEFMKNNYIDEDLVFFTELQVGSGGIHLRGDANCDDKVTIADAVAVLQYIANAEKYPLIPQGKVNADIDGVPGITGTDAIAIQCIDAGVEYVPKAQKKRTYSTKEELISLMVSEDEDFSEHGFIYAPGYKFDAVLNAGNDSTKDYLIIYGLDPEDCKLNEYRWGYMPDDIVINYTDFIYAAEPEFYSGSTYMPGALKEEYRITSESGNSLEVIFLIDRTAPGFMYEMTDERWTASYGFSYMPYVFPEETDGK